MAASDVTHAVNLAGKLAVAAVDFHRCRIYAIDAASRSQPQRVTAPDPGHLNHNLLHHHGNPSGAFEADHAEAVAYFKALAHALAPCQKLLLLGHGNGKSNASHVFEGYLEKHHRDLAAKIVGNVRTDIDDITDHQLLRLGEAYFGIHEPLRSGSGARST